MIVKEVTEFIQTKYYKKENRAMNPHCVPVDKKEKGFNTNKL